MEDFLQLATWLQVQTVEDRKRPHYEKEASIEELWQEDKSFLKVLPLEDLSVFSLDTATVNKYGEISVDNERFVLRKAHMKQVVVVKKEWNQFTCFTNDGEVIYQEYRPYMNTTRPIPWNEILGDWEIKPRAMRYSRFFPYLPERVQAYLLFKKEDIKKRITGLRQLLQNYSLQQIHELLQQEELLERSPHELGFLLEAKNISYPEKWDEMHTPAILVDYETDLGQYDRKLCPLLEGGIER